MGKKPEEKLVSRRLKLLYGYDAMWEHILRCNGQAFTINDIEEKTLVSRHSVSAFFRILTLAGYLKKTGEMKGKAFHYILVKPQPQRPLLNRDGSKHTHGLAKEQMWRTIKMIGAFTAADLAITASTTVNEVRLSHAKNYIGHLKKAGYLKVVRKHHSHGLSAVYRLLPNKSTGPKAPIVQKDKSIFDPNLKKVVWSKPKEGDE